jgi:hypothetical protein
MFVRLELWRGLQAAASRFVSMLGGFVEVSDKSVETILDAADTECPRHG